MLGPSCCFSCVAFDLLLLRSEESCARFISAVPLTAALQWPTCRLLRLYHRCPPSQSSLATPSPDQLRWMATPISLLYRQPPAAKDHLHLDCACETGGAVRCSMCSRVCVCTHVWCCPCTCGGHVRRQAFGFCSLFLATVALIVLR